MDVAHIPVLVEEVTNNLVSVENGLFVDATIGGAGHSYHLLERYERLHIIGIDVDEDALEVAQGRLKPFKERVRLIRGNFRDLRGLLAEVGVSCFDGILLDLGVSTFQIAGKRGFSFHDESFLDMRMDIRQKLTAYDVVNGYHYAALVKVIQEKGEEYRAPQIARAIIEERKKRPIKTAKELTDTILRSSRKKGRLHPATKTFQAVRIEVNGELDNIEKAIPEAIDMLTQGGRIGVISFHSLEDRIVKVTFRSSAALNVLTKKPITPERSEIQTNPSSRSAKLRIAEKHLEMK